MIPKKPRVQCPQCDNVKTFSITLTSDARHFKITCGVCGKFIRDIDEWKFHNHEEKVEYGNLAFPFGKFKGTLILSMNTEEQILYLKWVKSEKGIWDKMYEKYRKAIEFHLNHLPEETRKTVVTEDKSSKKFDPLSVFDVNFDEDSLPI